MGWRWWERAWLVALTIGAAGVASMTYEIHFLFALAVLAPLLLVLFFEPGRR